MDYYLKCKEMLLNEGFSESCCDIFFNSLCNEKLYSNDYRTLYLNLRKVFHIDFLEEYEKACKNKEFFYLKDI